MQYKCHLLRIRQGFLVLVIQLDITEKLEERGAGRVEHKDQLEIVIVFDQFR